MWRESTRTFIRAHVKSPAREVQTGSLSAIYPLLLEEMGWHKQTLYTKHDVKQKGKPKNLQFPRYTQTVKRSFLKIVSLGRSLLKAQFLVT